MTFTPVNESPTRTLPGDSAQAFLQRTVKHASLALDSLAGRYIVLCFFGSGAEAHTQNACKAASSRPDLFDDRHAAFFGVSIDPADETEARLTHRNPGHRHFYDFDLRVSKLYGALPQTADPDNALGALTRQWIVIDPTMRVRDVIPFRDDQSDIAEVISLVEGLQPAERASGIELMAPILYLPRVFETDLCQHLIETYEAQGGRESGFMREIDGRTVSVIDAGFKRRKDITLTDDRLNIELQKRFLRRVIPEIAKVHQFTATRMERFMVACYAAEDGGHFAPHRDNNSRGTAHRRFAVSVNLNDDFDGGEVSFPEYGPRSFKAPAGGAVVFSCSLLHRVSKVTRGRRYAFLPFLYDEAAARIRQENAHLIDYQKTAPGKTEPKTGEAGVVA
ncbi:2OG-Fe(II) oxygenase [Nisaea sediminum]|uniref:2OG-Fe(II) oxygenase n=1 Tax=Nisaea sediminum TaxID=2775867 RepID=UPI00186662E6|nr:2OG-Fe(II) oxygenase [Nisaea sediminum]